MLIFWPIVSAYSLVLHMFWNVSSSWIVFWRPKRRILVLLRFYASLAFLYSRSSLGCLTNAEGSSLCLEHSKHFVFYVRFHRKLGQQCIMVLTHIIQLAIIFSLICDIDSISKSWSSLGYHDIFENHPIHLLLEHMIVAKTCLIQGL